MKTKQNRPAAYILALGMLLLSAGCADVSNAIGNADSREREVCVEKFCLNDPVSMHESHANSPRVSKLGYPICNKPGRFSFQDEPLANGGKVRVYYVSVPGARKGAHLRISGLEQVLDKEPDFNGKLALIEKLNQEYGLPPKSTRRGNSGQYFSEGVARNGRQTRIVVTNHLFIADSENYDRGFSQQRHGAQPGCGK